MEDLAITNAKLEHISNMDALTNIYNRRGFNGLYAKEFKRAQREKENLAVMLIDIDFFKGYNDHYGHQEGDTCLAKVAETIQGALFRSTDFVARYGGEEFVIVLPSTDLKGAVKVGETLRKAVEDQKIKHEKSEASSYITVSIGVVSILPEADDQEDELVAGADKMLYQAKSDGRNRVLSSLSSSEENT